MAIARHETGAPRTGWRGWTVRPRRVLAAVMLAPLLALGGCGGGGGSGDEGEVVIGLTDAPGDFAAYTVSVQSLTLTRADGAVVETLPLATPVDFAQYTDLTEFLTAATVPAGRYTQATLHLDYSAAAIWVEDAGGSAVQATAVVDTVGNPITTLDVSVQLAGNQALVIAPGTPAHMTLDFDLNATNRVEFGVGGGVTVIVEPVLLADLELTNPKVHRVRGPLASVDEAAGSYQVILRPFYHRLRGAHDGLGTLTVQTDADTLFEINGQPYQGAAGLAALAAEPTFTATVALGDLVGQSRRFQAREVYAGSSVPGGTDDVIQGNVLSRSGDVVTVQGATLMRSDGSIVFHDEVAVTLSDQTVVRKQFSLDPFDIDAISVGQQVTVFGTLTSSDPDDLQLDASNGFVRLQLTAFCGRSVDTSADPAQPFVVDVQAINGRRVELFDFTGTGIDAAHDADPDYYEIDGGTLDLSAIEPLAPVRVGGFVTPFGEAPADFSAVTVVDLSTVPAVMAVNWQPADPEAFSAITATRIELALGGVGDFHHLARRGVTIDLTTLGTAPALVAQGDDGGLFLLWEGGRVQLHTRFSQFADDLAARLASGSAVTWLHARGPYDDGTAQQTVRYASVRLQ